MCKFESENAPGYRTVSTAIREWVAEGPEVIPIRWEVEEDQRRVRANLEYFERARQYVSPSACNYTESTKLTSISKGRGVSPCRAFAASNW
jgi:hypothetical protein